MRDSMGGVVTLGVIVFFIVLASGYMAFNVNYTKAFRMKNKIISLYEEYDGQCNGSSECEGKIREYAKSIGYSVRNLDCQTGFASVDSDTSNVSTQGNLFCVKKIKAKSYTDGQGKESKHYYYYKIVTKINIDIPVVSNLLNLRALYLSGDTKTFVENTTSSEG